MWPGNGGKSGASGRLGARFLAVLVLTAGLTAGALATPDQRAEQVWDRLESADWIALGADEPERVVYAFTDPNCPYCNLLWRASKPYYSEGLQVRHIMVGILKPSSPGKAAAILGADNPAAALRRHERNHDSGGIEPVSSPDDGVQGRLTRNQQLMKRFGIRATPGLVFRTAEGGVRKLMGMPRISQIPEIFRLPKQAQMDPALEPYK